MTTRDRRKEFAIEIVRCLQNRGFEALWAGGCVRDQLLGTEPKDYDVVTNALPPEVQLTFSDRPSLAIGAAFGVISVRGPRGAGQVEVATFRHDVSYSDGRRPDEVIFSTAEEDAQRRDFTINGLFYDLITDQIVDYVGGRADLEKRVIRAIGSPTQRFSEDKLRMLRAIRFATTLDFEIDAGTYQAIADHAAGIHVVSAERIAGELRQMLVHANRTKAVELLRQCKLLDELFPEVSSVANDDLTSDTLVSAAWNRSRAALDALAQPEFSVALATLLWEVRQQPDSTMETIDKICRRWRLSNDETSTIVWLLEHDAAVRNSRNESWPHLQRILIHQHISSLLQLADAIVSAHGISHDDVDFCRRKLTLPAEQLNPNPLISGDDLLAAGLPSGKWFKQILDRVRDAQLEGEIHDQDEAIELAQSIWKQS